MENNPENKARNGPPQQDEMKQALLRIFRLVRENSVLTDDGLVYWNATGSVFSNASNKSDSVGPQLYDGTSGIALFLAAYYVATKNADARDLALRFAARLRVDIEQMFTGAAPALHRAIGTGGLTGLPSVSYALVRLADWLKMPELLESARKVAMAITPQQILGEERFDIMGGCAGTLLSLLSFVEEVSAREMDTGIAMELALLCGRRLLETRTRNGSSPGAWLAVDSMAASGFAHGATGIAYSLVRLFQHTGREEFLDAALEGFAFERSLSSSGLQNRFHQAADHPPWRASWCEGPPGIALGRLLSLFAVNSNTLRYDLEEALSVTRALPESPVDHLCCGNFGRADIMHYAGNMMGRMQLTEHARELARQVLSRAVTSGFRFQPHSHHSTREHNFERNPSLFLGLSGVGYTLLRLSYPDLFPSALFLETQS